MIEYSEKKDIPQEVLNAEDKKYLSGFWNWIIRHYFYELKGLDVVNSFKNIIALIVAAYFYFKFEHLIYGVYMFLVGWLICLVLGYLNVHKLGKMNEWLGMRFSTHFGLKTYNYTQKQTELLEEILKELKNRAK